jgi:hypothetical protein
MCDVVHTVKKLMEVEIARGLSPLFDPQANRAGHLTPIHFGSAVGGLRAYSR